MFRPVADRWTESVRVVEFSPGSDWSSVGFELCEYLPDFAKSRRDLGFELCEYLPDFAKSRRILMRSQRISKRSGWSRQDMAGSRWFLGISQRQAKSQQIRQKMGDFPSSSGQILTDWIENVWFSRQIRSGRLNIGFSTSNPPTDPPFSGSGSRDPPPTVTGVGSAGYRAGSDGWGGWVGFRI